MHVNKGVPQSFQELKKRAAQQIQNGQGNVQSKIVEMGDAMLQAGVEPKSPQDRLAKRAWQAAGPQDKKALADMVTNLAQDESEDASLSE